MKRANSFRGQMVILTSCLTAFAMLLLTLVLQLVLAGVAKRDVNRVLEDRTEAVISSIQNSSTKRKLVVPDGPLDLGVAVYDDTGALVAGGAPTALATQYASLSRRTTTTLTTIGEGTRLRTTPFATSAENRGVVIVAEHLRPYEAAERYALIVSLITGVLVTLATGAIAAFVTHRALRPVADMASTATDWSEHDLAQRFDLGPPSNEITALGKTLDALLDKVATAIRSEQRLTSELAHELRTPLTAIQGTADLTLLRPDLPDELRTDLEQIAASSRQMATTITTLLELARSGAQSDDTSSLVEVAASLGPSPRLEVDVPDVRLGLPGELALRALSPVVENALRSARTTVWITALPKAGWVEVYVDDDGPGVRPGNATRIFEPGETDGNPTGSGLGLAIARRVSRSVGGDVLLGDGGSRTRFVVRLPVG